MREHAGTTTSQKVGVDDLLLAVLGLLAGPLLWWIGEMWNHAPAASSLQTLEYWIAMICGFVGISLSLLWLVFVIAGVGFALALKTKNKVVGYWAGLFTPKFLQRIIISVVGIQLALGSQAFAAPEATTQPAAMQSAPVENPFIPDVVKQPSKTHEPSVQDDVNVPSASANEHVATPTATAYASNHTATSSPSLVPQPRQTSQIFPHSGQPSPTNTETLEATVEPTPRQTTTIPVRQQQGADDQSPRTPGPRGLPGSFTPQKPLASPLIAPPNPNRTAKDPTTVVTAGDCLWDIAHHELGADATSVQIDQRWRQWWQHNRDVIGEDPHMLRVGTVLTAPPFTQ